MTAAVEAREVRKRYGDFAAVDGLSFSVPAGCIYGVLGPNGAGKTSTIRMLMKITLPDEGDLAVFGAPLSRLDTARIGYLPEERGLYKKMKIAEMLVFFAEIHDVPRRDARSRALQWLERVGLAEYAQRTSEDLSKGMQQKVQFIATMLHEPEMLILDEPFSGLDPVNANLLKDIILEYHRRGHTIILSTHMMEQVEKMCERICLIHRGKVVLSGSIAEVKKKFGRGGVTLRFSGDGAFLRTLPGVEHVNDYGNEMFLRLAEGTDPGSILTAALGRVDISRFELAEPSIHDIFIEQVQDEK